MNARPKPPWRRLLAALLILGCLYLMLRWFEYRQVYQPTRELEAAGADLGRPVEQVWLTAADGVRLHAWFYPAVAGSARSRTVILLCHGNAGNISHRLEHAAALLETGCAVFLFDYRGYGRSEGRPTEAGTYLDAQAAAEWVTKKGFAPDQIVALGESLGGAVAAELATREPLGGLVLLGSFTSVPDLGAELLPWLPVRWLATIRYDTIRKLPQIKVPLMIVHSRTDEIVGFPHAERNFAAAPEPKLLWEIGGGHNDFLWVDRERYLEGWRHYLELHETRAKPGPGSSPSRVHGGD